MAGAQGDALPRGTAVDAPSSHWQLIPSLALPTAQDAHPTLTFPAIFGGLQATAQLKTRLPTCRLWYTQHLQIPVQKTGKTPQIPQWLSRGPGHHLLCSHCSEHLDACLDLGTTGHLCQQLSVPLWGSVGSQCQGVSANHQVQLISSLRNQGNSQTAVKVSRPDAVYLPGWI